MSSMDVDDAADPGVEEKKGEGASGPVAAAVPPAPERTQKGKKGEGDRNVMLHPVRFSLGVPVANTTHVLACRWKGGIISGVRCRGRIFKDVLQTLVRCTL